jgi:membrane protease YdiL (CAAX protease family)
MPYCPKCASEYRPGFTRCEECDADLVPAMPSPPSDPDAALGPWKTVFLGDPPKAAAVQGALESAGIDTLAPDEYTPNLGWYAPSSIGTLRVLVHQEDLTEAEAIVAGMHRLDAELPELSPEKENAVTDPLPPPAPESIPPRVPLWTLVLRGLSDSLIAMALPIVATLPPAGSPSYGDRFLATLLSGPAFLAVGLWRRRRMAQTGELAQTGGQPEADPAHVVGAVLVGAFLAGVGLAYNFALKGMGIISSHSSPFTDSTLFTKVLTILLAVVVAPISEEVFFRGGVLAGFRNSGHAGWGVVFSSALFAVMHFRPYEIPDLFLFGVIIAYLFLGTRTLRAPIIAHAVSNAITLGIALF